jgi:hypothetical protein
MGFIGSSAPATHFRLRLLLIFVLLTGFALRMHELTRQNIWWDEARNIDVALLPFLEVATAPELDIHPPVYFWLLHAWGRINGIQEITNPVILSFLSGYLSAAAGVGAVALLYVLTSLAAGSTAGALAALVGSMSPFWLAESQEARMYTVGFGWLLAAAVAYWMARATGRSTVHRRAWQAGFVLFSALALLTHYNTIFVLVAWYGWWLVWAVMNEDRRGALLEWLACGAATALLVLPAAPIALRQIPGYANPNLVVPSVLEYLRQNWQAYLGGYAFAPELGGGMGRVWLLAVLILGLGGALLTTLAGSRQRVCLPTPLRFSEVPGTLLLSFLWVWLVGSLALYYLAVVDRGAFNVRYSSFVTPALYALLGVGLAAWGRWRRPLAVVAAAAALSLWPQALYADLYDERFAREDIAGVTKWLRERAGSNDVIFVDQKYPFGFYYDRYAIDPEVVPAGAEAAAARYLFVDINTIDTRLGELAAGAERVYWVQWYESDTDPRRAVSFLLDQAGARGGEQSFRGYSIDWWELDPPNDFALAPNLAPAIIAFPPAVQTVAVSLPPPEATVGEPLPVVIRWQRTPGGDVTRPLKARVALYNGAGERLAQRDERLLNDRHLLPTEWTEADRPLNVYLLEPPADLPAGEYRFGLLVYDGDTLEPLGTVDAAGNPAGVEATLGTITLTQP